MKLYLPRVMLFFLLIQQSDLVFADLKYQPISFTLSTDKESYYEGEKITFNITITNNDTKNAHPVLLPHTQNVGQKLFCLNVYDKANNTWLLRYSEDKMLNMMVHDTGTVMIRYLKPLEKIVIPIYLNDFENYFSYHTQTASHHSFGVPLFAGVYKLRLTYNPKGIIQGDSIYNYYEHTEIELPNNGKQAMPSTGGLSNVCLLKIKRSNDTVVMIERTKYYIKTDGYMYYYFNKYVEKINTAEHLVHITTLPADSCSLPGGEYFYNQFDDLFNEYINRFNDGDIREYRKYTNWCPQYLYTERYDDLKQKTHHELQLPNKSFYIVIYNQPSGSIKQEIFCSEDGTLCDEITYVYNKNGKLVTKHIKQTEPCSVIIIDGKRRSATRVSNLEYRYK